MKILFIGDIVGSPGRKIVHERLADILAQRHVDLCIINCENSASGFGVTPRIAEEFFAEGADVLTSGNHIWKRKEIIEYFPTQPRLLRPANFPNGSPGRGLYVGREERHGLRRARSARTHVHDADRRSLSHGRARARENSARCESDRGGHARRGHIGKGRHGLASRRQSFRRAWDAHARRRRPIIACCRRAPRTSPTWA